MRTFRLLPVAGLLVVGAMGFFAVAQETRERAADDVTVQSDQTVQRGQVDPNTDLPVDKPNYRTDRSTRTTTVPRPLPPQPPVSPPPIPRPPVSPPKPITPPISIPIQISLPPLAFGN